MVVKICGRPASRVELLVPSRSKLYIFPNIWNTYWLCIARFGCDSDRDSNRALRTVRDNFKTHTSPAKQRPVCFPHFSLLVLKVPKRGQFHAVIRVTTKRCDLCAQRALGRRTVPTVPQGHKDRVTTLGKSRGPPKSPAETLQNPRRDPRRGPLEPSERQISSEGLVEGCAPRMATLRNLKNRTIAAKIITKKLFTKRIFRDD